ncbi:MAG: TolB family protein, partial [Candidatus Thorarchaeota archaeon]
ITGEIAVIPDLRPNGYRPEWSPDGRRLLVAGMTEEQLDRQSETEHAETDIWTIDAITGFITNISSDPDHNTFPLWSPDGSRIAFHTYTYDVEDRSQPELIDSIWIVNVDGSNRQLLVSSSFPMGFPLFDSRYDWSPDGSSMVLVLNTLSSEDSRSVTSQLMQDIWIKDIDGIDHELLLSIPFSYGYTGKLRWNPDGSMIAFEWAPQKESAEGKLRMGDKHIYLLEVQ